MTQAPADTDEDTDDDVEHSPALKATPVKPPALKATPMERTPATKATPQPPAAAQLTLTCDITLGPSALAIIAARVEELFLRKMMSTLDQEENQ